MAVRSTRRASRSPDARSRTAKPGPLRLFDASRYGGRWVATRHGEVVADGDSFAAVDTAVRRLGLQDEVILTRVPAKGELAR